jgi:hypothetical protein
MSARVLSAGSILTIVVGVVLLITSAAWRRMDTGQRVYGLDDAKAYSQASQKYHRISSTVPSARTRHQLEAARGEFEARAVKLASARARHERVSRWLRQTGNVLLVAGIAIYLIRRSSP